MNKRIINVVKRVKKQAKFVVEKSIQIKNASRNISSNKEHRSLYERGKGFVIQILKFKYKGKSKKTSKQFLEKNKRFFTKENLRALFTYLFSDFSKKQVEDMLLYIFGDLDEEERENVLQKIFNHISKKEYGFLLRD